MTSVTTSIRIDKELKQDVSKLAKEMWLSLGQVVEHYLRRFQVEKKITFQPIFDDTDLRYYDTDDMIPVNEPVEVVLDFLEKLYPESERNG